MKPEIQLVPVVEVHTPPAPLYAKCEEPRIRAIINVGDIGDSLLDYKDAFFRCAVKIDKIRSWAEKAPKSTADGK